jgi:hypothetical protein
LVEVEAADKELELHFAKKRNAWGSQSLMPLLLLLLLGINVKLVFVVNQNYKSLFAVINNL